MANQGMIAHQRVKDITADGKVSLSDAFEQVSSESMSAAAVKAAYYRFEKACHHEGEPRWNAKHVLTKEEDDLLLSLVCAFSTMHCGLQV